MKPWLREHRAECTWGTATAVCAFIGAYFATAWLFAALMAAAGVLVYIIGLTYRFRSVYAYRTLLGEIDADRDALARGRRTRCVRMLVIGRDGTLFTGTLSQLMDDEPESGIHVWDDPYFVRIYHSPDALDKEFRARAT